MKKISQYIPLQLCVFLVLGVLIGYYNSIPFKYIVFLLAILCISLVGVFKITKPYYQFRWAFQLLSYFLILFVGIATISLRDVSQQKTHYSHFITDKHTVVLQINKVLKPTAYHNKYYANILQIDKHNSTGKVVLNIAKDSLSKKLKLGNTYVTKTSFSEINSPLNPHTFDYKDYLKKQGVFHQLSLKNNDLLALSIKNNSLKILAAQLREKIQYSLEKYPFTNNELGIINAIVLGQRQSISKDLLNSYAGAGAIHILAVSGLHVGILFLILSFLLKPLEKLTYGNHLKTLLIVLFLWGFALLTGLSGSVVRAVTMFTFIAIGLSFKNQKSGVLHALITSFFLLVLIYPLFVFDVGFQMSYAAVLGIVLLYPKVNVLFPKIRYYIPRKIWQLFCVSVSATIGTLPISLYYFHQFPGLFFLSNIVIVPFLGLIMGVGIFVAMLSLLQILPDFLVQIYSFVLSTMNSFIKWIAHQEAFLFRDISFSIFALIGCYIVITIGYRWLLDKKAPRFQTFLISILLLQCVFIYEKYETETHNEFVVFHKTKESIIGTKKAKDFHLLHSFDSIINPKQLNFLKNYKVGTNINQMKIEEPIPNILLYDNKKILVIDSLGIYKDISFKPDMVILRQSPKINVSRLAQNLQPKIIVADGSNYKSYVNFWRETCQEHNLKFHYTGKDGALILE